MKPKPPGHSTPPLSLKRLLAFDWDGTLIDSEAKIIAMMQAAADDLRLLQPSAADIRGIIGLGLPLAMQILFPDQDEQVRKRVTDRYRNHFNAAPASELFPSVRETIYSLWESGFYMAVATGKSRRGLDNDLVATGIGRFFHATRCADETLSKPNPDMLLELMAQLGVGQEETLMVGDTDHDLKMAKNAGVDAVAVTYGVQEKQRLLQWEPCFFIDSLHELIPPLMRTNS